MLREQDLEWREIDDEIVVLDERNAAYLAVSGSGILIWHMLSERTDREALIAALVDTYDVDHTCAGEDVDAFLAALADRGLLGS
ncbi:MAG: PqqD family protein [Solirubrobacteraceae bacterium]